VVRVLLSHEAVVLSLNQTDATGKTALWLAASNGKTQVCAFSPVPSPGGALIGVVQRAMPPACLAIMC
jgi:hypothetical protein